jgi:hypothetical protein
MTLERIMQWIKRSTILIGVVIFLIIIVLPKPGYPHTFKGELNIGLSQSSGVSEKNDIDVAFVLKRKAFLLNIKTKYISNEKQIIENKGNIKLKYNPVINDKWSLWFFNQTGYNKKREVRLENFIGGGPKYSFSLSRPIVGSISIGILQHHIKYTDNDIDNMARISLRVKGGWQISKNLSFNIITFYQPNIKTYQDYIIVGKAELKFRITEVVGLKLKIEDEYRSISKIDENNSLTTILALSINF